MSATPFLDRLALPPADRQALHSNGFVQSERRGQRLQFKLRYRQDGKQRVRCLGSDPTVAEGIRRELKECQSKRALSRSVRNMVREARDVLRKTKASILPVVLDAGYHFHGRTIRRRRGGQGTAD